MSIPVHQSRLVRCPECTGPLWYRREGDVAGGYCDPCCRLFMGERGLERCIYFDPESETFKPFREAA